MRKVVCEPSKREALVIHDQNKFGVLMKTYYKCFSNYAASGIVNDNVETTGILEYEEITG